MGPNNTNTPSPTPNNLPGATPGSTPTPTPTPTPTLTPTPTPTFSGPAPTTNPFASQNSIPSSATGDIKLATDQPKKSKKGPIIVITILVLLVIGATVAALILSSQPQNTSQSSEQSTPVSRQDLQSSFNALANTLISNNQSTDTSPNLTTDISNWQLTKINNNDSAKTQATYADSLGSVREAFYSNVEAYTSQISEQDTADFVNLTDSLNDKLTVAVLYLRGNQFSVDLPSLYLETPDNINDIIYDELSAGYDVFDTQSADLVGNIAIFYDAIVDRTRILKDNNCYSGKTLSNSCVTNLRNNYNEYPDLQFADSLANSSANDANNQFTTLSSEIPALLSNIKTTMENLNE